MQKWPGLTFTRRSLNQVLNETYKSMLSDPRLAGTVRKAWKVTGLYPYILA
jgi:hypothetical protein